MWLCDAKRSAYTAYMMDSSSSKRPIERDGIAAKLNEAAPPKLLDKQEGHRRHEKGLSVR